MAHPVYVFVFITVLSWLSLGCDGGFEPVPLSALPTTSESNADREGVAVAPAPGTPCTDDGSGSFVVDCNGACVPSVHIGDGTCDDGSAGGPDLSCPAFASDRGDCASSTPAPLTPCEPPEDYPFPESEAFVVDCAGSCIPAAWLGDGTCQNGFYTDTAGPFVLTCEELAFDGGDCSNPTVDDGVTGCTTPAGMPGIVGCDGACVPAEWLGDGVCDDFPGGNLDCPLHEQDGGDCASTAEDQGATEENAVGCQAAGGLPGVLDCDGECVPAAWVGDGVCDDFPGGNLDCPLHHRDGGDCTV